MEEWTGFDTEFDEDYMQTLNKILYYFISLVVIAAVLVVIIFKKRQDDDLEEENTDTVSSYRGSSISTPVCYPSTLILNLA